MSDNDTTLSKCTHPNATLSFLQTRYEGIPDTLVVNVVSWLVLLGLFTILRKRAWNYGQIALVQKTDEKWMQLFYSRQGSKSDQQESDPNVSVTSIESASSSDHMFRNWLFAVFKIKDENILQKCGADALQYLSFQRHVMAFMFIITVISISIVLPVNMTGDLTEADSLGHTTINNLDPNTSLLWIHATLAFTFLPLLIYVMRRFSIKLKVEDEDHVVSRTLMISNIPRRNCDKEDLKRHFREAYPEAEIQDIQLAYDVSRVNSLHESRARTCAAIKYCDNYLRKTGQRLNIQPYVCGYLCSCCSCPSRYPSVDALEYYLAEEQLLRNKLDGARNCSLQRPLGIAFVTFSSPDDAKSIYYEHQRSQLCGSAPAASSISNQLKTCHWNIAFAPAPQDIKWENLSTSTNYWYLKVVLVNFFLLIILFFMTTPAIVVKTLRGIKFISSGIDSSTSAIISDFLPTLMLWTVAVVMPVIVSYSDRWMNHWTRSECNRSIMNKTFYFLLFMVLILPSLELQSIEALYKGLKDKNDTTVHWDCIFLPAKGAFYINYVTTSAFIGTTLELIRFPELFSYALLLSMAKSKAEAGSVRRSVIREFQFGENYAWFLLIFTISITYSLSCPLIMPFGLAYMVLKHLVDRYNLYFAYSPSNISQNIHASAITNVMLAVILPQISLFLFFFVHQTNKFIMYCSLIGFILTLAVYFSHWMFQCCRGFSPFAYQPKSPNASQQSTPKREISTIHKFVPQVLQPGGSPALQHPDRNSQQVGEDPMGTLQRSYGTNKSDVESLSEGDVLRVVPPDSPSEQPLTGVNSPLYQAYETPNGEA